MTIADIITLRDLALAAAPLPDPQWPPSVYYRFIALLAKQYSIKIFVELGTCGGGCAYNVAMMSPDTTVVSIDVNKLASVGEVLHRCPNFRFYLGDSVKMASVVGGQCGRRIGMLFIDTEHTYEQTKAEFDAWLPYLMPGCVVCFDDINHPGVGRFWAECTGRYQHTEFADLATLHIGGEPTNGGFGVILV